MCHQATCVLPSLPITVGAGRNFIAERLSHWGVEVSDVAHVRVSDVLLAASELLSNAVRVNQGRGIGLELLAHRDEIIVSVTDDAPEAPALVQRLNPYAEGGRGLALVDALSERWGQVVHGEHKTVWFIVSVPKGSCLARGCHWQR
jgi:anti-sigma regulatory factor (Ser/Thr protein kinase)